MIKDQILQALKIKREPADGLFLILKNLSAKEDIQEFWDVLKEVSLCDSDIVKRVNCLFVISCKNQEMTKTMVHPLIDEEKSNLTSYSRFIPSVLGVVKYSRDKSCISFCKEVLQWAQQQNKSGIEYLALSCLVVLDWKQAQTEIIEYLTRELGKDKEDIELTYIDFFAYFEWFYGKDEFLEFIKILPKRIFDQMNELAEKSHDRAVNHYGHIKRD